MHIRPCTAADLPIVSSILAAERLPTDDLAAPEVALWLAVDAQGTASGCVGLEHHGAEGLLRSLAVVPGRRGTGLGGRLLAIVEAAAAEGGIQRLHLLTTGDGAFFRRHGYRARDRGSVPGAILGTRQFSCLCPASARLLVKQMAAATIQS